MLKPRLSASTASGGDVNEVQEAAESDSIEDDAAEVDADDTVDDESSEIDVGHSKLNAFYEFLVDDAKVAAWLSEEKSRQDEIRKRERKSKDEQRELLDTPEDRLKALLASLLRPAMIVDGQHRVWGAYNSDKAPIKFSVCAIQDADWVEQVFQFVVLNRLAKPISPSFLTSILNTSLTNSEVGLIEKRLDAIGIRNTDRIIMKYLNHDERSPFFGIIAEPAEVAGIDNKGKLSDKGMIRLAKRWLNIKKKKKEMEMFQKAIGAKNLTAARKEWSNHETWVPYFYAFWDAVRDRYSKDGLWEKREGFHLLYIVTMHAMQELFLEAKANGDIRFSNIDDFRAQVTQYFADVQSTFFRGWKATGLQSGDGPEWIKAAIQELRQGTRLSTLEEQSSLFKEI